MRTTDNCAMPGPGDIREREPLPMTESEAREMARNLAKRDPLQWGGAWNDYLVKCGGRVEESDEDFDDEFLPAWLMRKSQ